MEKETNDGQRPNGQVSGSPLEDEAQLIEAIEGAHAFPGFYPVVVIARSGPQFSARLSDAVRSEQGEDPFTISTRESRRGNYISYRVELFVENARTALARKAALADLHGVLILL